MTTTTPVSSRSSVGVIGLGRMGSGMAHNIRKAGFPLRVYNRSQAKTQPLLDEGATLAATPAMAAAADVLLSSLSDDQSVLDIMRAADGILAGMRPGAVHISTTTISPEVSRRLGQMHAEHGSLYVAANVLGRPSAAHTGELAALVAGTPEAVAVARPVVASFARTIVEAGTDPVAAASTKLIINFFLAGLLETLGEAYALAEKQQLDLGVIRNLVLHQVLPNPALAEYSQRMLERRFGDAGATLVTGAKDLSLILSEAARVMVPLPIGSLVHGHILSALARGEGDLDWCVSTQMNRLAAGLS